MTSNAGWNASVQHALVHEKGWTECVALESGLDGLCGYGATGLDAPSEQAALGPREERLRTASSLGVREEAKLI